MEGNFLTAGDLALHETQKMPRFNYEGGGYPYGGGYKRRDSLQGASITGVVLGGTALAVAIAAALGVNAASKARSKGNEKVSEFIGKDFTIPIAATTVTTVTLAKGTTINTIAGAPCKKCSRNFVSESPLVVTVA